MRPWLALVILVAACSGSPPAKADRDASNGSDAATAGDGGVNNSGGDAAGGADATPGPDGDTAVDMDPSTPGGSNGYVEPTTIRGGACADAAAAATATLACGPGGAEFVYCSLDDPTRVVMAVCSTGGRSQCEVLDYCEEGWTACGATQYVERGGRDVQPDFSVTNRAWLAACVQDATGQHLRNGACLPCDDFDPNYSPEVMWYCDGAVVYEGGMDGDRLGVVTSPDCFRVDQNSPTHEAYWALDFASGGTSFVVCCADDF